MYLRDVSATLSSTMIGIGINCGARSWEYLLTQQQQKKKSLRDKQTNNLGEGGKIPGVPLVFHYPDYRRGTTMAIKIGIECGARSCEQLFAPA